MNEVLDWALLGKTQADNSNGTDNSTIVAVRVPA